MEYLFSIQMIATVTLAGAGAEAAEFPTFERMGFPITRHQVAVIGAQDVQEQSATPTLTFGGLPASPHQIAVLTPRPEITTNVPAVKPIPVGLAVQ
jgi:hypothetical protein